MLNFKRTSLGAIALLVSAMVLPACESNEIAQDEGETNVTTEDLTENTDQLIGQTVTVRSDVEEEVGEVGFILEADELFGGEPILVLNASGTPFLLPQDTPVQVTGEVTQFVLADVERDYDLDLEEDLYVDYEERPAIIAESLALAPDPEELAEDPEAYYNQVVAVEGEVNEMVSPGVFTLGEDGWFNNDELLVVGVDPGVEGSALEDGENVTVTGVLRPYISAEFERDYDLTWDLDLQQNIEAEYEQKPVLAATEVYPSAVEE